MIYAYSAVRWTANGFRIWFHTSHCLHYARNDPLKAKKEEKKDDNKKSPQYYYIWIVCERERKKWFLVALCSCAPFVCLSARVCSMCRNGARSIIYYMAVSTTTESIFLQRIYKAINFHLILVYAWCTSFCFQFSYSSFDWSGIRWFSFISIGLIDNNAISIGWFLMVFLLIFFRIDFCYCWHKKFSRPSSAYKRELSSAFACAGDLVKVD